PWYRSKSPDSPKSMLTADPATADWHTFGMEWKEHVAWIAPILATIAAGLVVYYGAYLARNRTVRNIAIGFFVAAFATAPVAGTSAALTTKAAPVHYQQYRNPGPHQPRSHNSHPPPPRPPKPNRPPAQRPR